MSRGGLSAVLRGSVFNREAGTVLPKSEELLRELGVPLGFVPLSGVVIGHIAGEVPMRELSATIETNFIR